MKTTKLYTKPVPQNQPLKGQVENHAGGFVYQIDNWARLERFLILGSDSNTYYQKAADLTRENAACVIDCYRENPARTVNTITSVSVDGRAPKNDPAVFALALGAAWVGDARVRQLALAALPAVCRTSTHLFQFVAAVRSLGRGWGRTLKRAVANWYNEMPVDAIGYQLIKYREREGYTHKRLFQTAHPAPGKDQRREALYRYVWGKAHDSTKLPIQILAHEHAMEPALPKRHRIGLIKDHNLPWEAIPTECNADPDYWEAQLPSMGLTALVRNLGNMSRIGLIKPLSEAEKLIVRRLADQEQIHRSRLHPFNILQASAVYGQGHGFRGTNSWDVNQKVVDALDGAFYKAFKNVIPAGKRFLLALDVSGSMTGSLGGSPLSCRDASAAMALVTAATEHSTHIIGFCSSGGRYYQYRTEQSLDGLVPINITPRQTLRDAIQTVTNLPFGGTDCALPMIYALHHKIPVDVFVVYTDNETWAGRIHPSEALRQYRRETGIPAKLVVVGMTATEFSIADPTDPGMMDFVGFDAAAPAIMADFARK